MRKLFLLITFITFYSCNKSGPSYVKGTVYERGTDKPIAGALIMFRKRNHIALNGQKDKGVINSVFTDNDGKYTLEFTRSHLSEYTVSCFHPDYITYINPVEQDYEIKQGRQALNFTLIPQGYLRIRFQRTGNSSNRAHCWLTEGWAMSTISPYFRPPGSSLPYDSLSCGIWPVSANYKHNIFWRVIDMSGVELGQFSADFVINKGDTLIHTIQFN